MAAVPASSDGCSLAEHRGRPRDSRDVARCCQTCGGVVSLAEAWPTVIENGGGATVIDAAVRRDPEANSGLWN